MEETVPIILSLLTRRNRFFSKNPYGVILSHLCVSFRIALADDTARNGA